MRLLHAPLLHFIAIGSLLYAAHAVLTPTQPERVRVSASEVAALSEQWQRSTGRPPTPEQIDRMISSLVDDELLVREARARGWDRNDPVIHQRLVRNLRFLDTDADAGDETLLTRAYAMGMERDDIVVRRRLLERMKLAIAAGARNREPREEDLERYYRDHAETFERPARLRLSHVYLSRDRRGAGLHTDAVALGERLRAGALPPEQAAASSDPFLLEAHLPLWSVRELAERFGADFAEGVTELPTGAWSDPIPSSYGEHLVWVHEREAAAIPPLAEVRRQVELGLFRQWEGEALRRALAELRAGVTVEVETGGEG
jgi:peptidyl-prolyl cis-trans isomerase C